MKMTAEEKEIVGNHMEMSKKHLKRAQELCKHPSMYIRSAGYGLASHANCDLCLKEGIWEDMED